MVEIAVLGLFTLAMFTLAAGVWGLKAHADAHLPPQHMERRRS